MMKRRYSSLGIKFLCGFLGLLFFLLAAFCTVTGVYMGGMGYFESMPATFEESNEFEIITDNFGLDMIRYNLRYSTFSDGEIGYYDYRQDNYPAGFYYILNAEVDGKVINIYTNFLTLPDKELYQSSCLLDQTYALSTGESDFEYELNHSAAVADLPDNQRLTVNYTVNYWIDTDASATSAYGLARSLYGTMSYLRGNVVALGILAYIGLFASVIILLCQVGRRPSENGSKLFLNLFNRMPYALAVCISLLPLVGCQLLIYVVRDLMFGSANLIFIVLLSAIGAAILFYTGLLSALATTVARLKNKAFIKTTLTYYLCSFVWRITSRLGIVWRSVILWGGLLLFIFICHWVFRFSWAITVLVSLVSCLTVFVIAIYSAIQLNRVRKGADALAKGQLNQRTDTAGLTGDYKKIAADLNMINRSISIAVDERLKSERLKTELITNVSHDVKTPLTSIINYVDLLKKEDLPTENAKEYLTVLDKQSQRLKKMLEDLTEASKAATGNIEPKREEVDLSELLLQSIGEYEEKFDKAFLTCLLQKPDDPVVITADGTLVWRCVNNLLSNMVKYSMAGTRAYVTLEDKGTYVSITFRNISRDRITVSPDELTERFVRGDSSRSSEGSGLGLAIVKSFAELMKGYFGITVDGDLFKAELRFNK